MINQIRWYARRVREALQGLARSLHQSGLSGAVRYVSALVRARRPDRTFASYDEWFRYHLRSRVRTAKAAAYRPGPLFSVVVPVVRWPTRHLGECVSSVESQIYHRWQLVLAVSGQVDERALAAIRKRVERNPRIETIRLPEDAEIARVTNVGVESSSGEFLCLLDQDDVLTIDALSLASSQLGDDHGIDYLYADEDRISPYGRFVDPLFRPAPSVDLMLSTDLISSPLAVRRSLVVEVGGMREGFEGAQDHDLALRLVDAGAKAAHLGKVAIHRRITNESAAGRHKSISHDVGLKAVSESISRRGITATARLGPSSGQYEILFRPPPQGSLGIVVLSNRALADIVDQLHFVVASNLPALSVQVVVVRNMISHDGTVADDGSEGWPEEFGDWSGSVATYRGWPNRAAALNLGTGLLGDTDYILFMDDNVDVRSPQVLGQLLGNLDRPDVGAVGPTEIHAFADHEHPEGIASCLRDVTALSGSFMLTKTTLFRELGGFPHRLENHFYDVAYCLSLRTTLGKRVVLDPLFPVDTAGSGTSKDPRISDYDNLAFTHLFRALAPNSRGDRRAHWFG